MGEIIRGPAKRVALLHQDDNDTAPVAAATVASKIRVVGLSRIQGGFHCDEAPAAGFPRVRQSLDGTNWSLVQQIAQDPSQSEYQYYFDFKIRMPYVQVQWTQGGTNATYLRANVYATAGGESANDGDIGSVLGQLQLVRTDKDTHFTTAISANEHEFENLTGLDSNKGVIESISLMAEDDRTWHVHFWRTDAAEDADLDTDAWLGMVELNNANSVNIGNAESGTYRHIKAPLAIPYEDADNSNELHISLVPVGAAKTAGASGEVVLIIGFRSE